MPAGPSSPRLSYALSQVFSRRWWGVSLAVLAISLGLARLGVWQLDRLAERRARSATLEARLAAPPLLLSRTGLTGEGVAPMDGGALPDLDPLAYRRVVLRGSFDYAREVALVNQVRQGQLGFHLLTPLVLEGEGPPGATLAPAIPAPGGVTPVPASAPAVLVDRGWVPALPGAARSPQDWAPYRAPGAGSDGSAVVQVTGWVRPPPAGPPRGGRRERPAGTPGGRPAPGHPPGARRAPPPAPGGGAGAGRGAPGAPHPEGSRVERAPASDPGRGATGGPCPTARRRIPTWGTGCT